MGRKMRRRGQRVLMERRGVLDLLEEIEVETTIDDFRPVANSYGANRYRVWKRRFVDPRPHRPPQFIANNMTVFGFFLVKELHYHLLARSDSTFAQLPRLLTGRCDCAQQRADAMMMQRTVMNMGLAANGSASMDLIGVPSTTVEILVRSMVRILLLLQTETKTSRRHCLLCFRNPQVPAPRACDQAQGLGVRITRNGARIAAVSILPPFRDFDPPMLCTKHQKRFTSLVHKYVLRPGGDSHMVLF